MSPITGRTILLVISGGIAAYKSLELIRLLKKAGVKILPVLTKGGEKFVTQLSVSALCEHPVYTDLWSLKDENEMGHIRLSREADLIVVAPASANLMAKLANGIADDLASTTLLAANKKVMLAPAMNPEMWNKPSTRRNIETLKNDGHIFVGPDAGDMACGETGTGRMVEAADIFEAITAHFKNSGRLKGQKVLVTSGPTYEPIDPVRFIGNRSSGKQGHAIAAALAKEGADVTLVTGPVMIPDPDGVTTIHVETADEMLASCLSALPSDIAICAAAVADWSVETQSGQKMKKQLTGEAPELKLKENQDILSTLANHANRPNLVIGFAAETENVVPHAQQKLLKKGCDWIVANQVGKTGFPVFGTDENCVTLVTRTNTIAWPTMSKHDVAARLADEIIKTYEEGQNRHDQRRPKTSHLCQ